MIMTTKFSVTVSNNIPTPHPVKENVVVIKPAPVDKNKGNKKEKVKCYSHFRTTVDFF